MKRAVLNRMKWLTLACLLIVACAYAQPEAAQPTPSQVSLSDVSQQTWQLASDGRLNEALQRVRELADQASPDSPLSTLGRDIATFETHVRDHRAASLTEYSAKLDLLSQQLEQNKLREALQSALQAQDLAESPPAFLADERVVNLVGKSEQAAAEMESSSKWLGALTLYRGLAGLYDSTNKAKYHQALRRVAMRVGMLDLYAPRALHELQVAHAKEEGLDAPEPRNWEEDRWQNRLSGIVPEMLNEGLLRARVQHVDTQSFEEMLHGGVEALKLLTSVQGLEAAFPALADKVKTQAFIEKLDALEAEIAGVAQPLDEEQAMAMVQRVLQANHATVALPQEVIVKEFGEGALSLLDDFTNYIWPHDKAQFDRTTTQRLSGVGIQIRILDGQLTVISPIEDSPAFAAGLRAGDKIMTIDGKSTQGIEVETAVERITGPEGTRVTLGILSPGQEEARDVPLTRASIRIVSVTGWSRQPGGAWDYYIDPKLKIGYVKLSNFGRDSVGELDAAIEQLKSRGGVGGLVLDLRANPGGLLDAAVQLSDRFVSRGEIVSTTQKSIFGRRQVFEAKPTNDYDPFPVVVLVNRFSASASEILSGALKDHGRALIVGERTLGKGSVQNIFPIGRQSAYLKLTIAYYCLPQGQIIHRKPESAEWGVDPDVAVRMSDEQIIAVNQARSFLDVLRKEGEAVNPNALVGREEKDEEGEASQPVTSADQLLERGMDPQLEAALLLLKTRVVAEQTAVARNPAKPSK